MRVSVYPTASFPSPGASADRRETLGVVSQACAAREILAGLDALLPYPALAFLRQELDTSAEICESALGLAIGKRIRVGLNDEIRVGKNRVFVHRLAPDILARASP